MKILSRYTAFQFLLWLILSLFCVILVFITIDYVGQTQLWQARTTREALEYYLNYAPHILYLISPIAVLIASSFTIGNMARHFELVAMRATGHSLYRIFAPIILIGVLMVLGNIIFIDKILPDANYRRFKIQEPKTSNNLSDNSLEKRNFVYIAPNSTTYFFQHYSGVGKTGSGVTLLLTKDDTITQRYDAKRMVWENHWVLKDGIRRVFINGVVNARPFKESHLHDLKDQPDDLVNTRIFPDEMDLNTLQNRINILKRSGESTRRFETQWHFKISGCLVSFILLLFGLSLMANTAAGGMAMRFGIAILMTFFYYILLRFGIVLGENGELSPVMGAWLGNIVFGFLAVVLFWKAARL